jgi:hypothetical protein
MQPDGAKRSRDNPVPSHIRGRDNPVPAPPSSQDETAILARWRELGEWWNGEPYQEFTRYIDGSGIRREEAHTIPLDELKANQTREEEDHSEEWSLRIHKKREEKMALARLSYGSPDLEAPSPRMNRVEGRQSEPLLPRGGRANSTPKGSQMNSPGSQAKPETRGNGCRETSTPEGCQIPPWADNTSKAPHSS